MKMDLTKGSALLGRLKNGWQTYSRNRAAIFGLSLFVILILAAASAPLLTPYRYDRLVTNPFKSPSSSYPMGSDNLGRDTFTEVLYGLRTSLTVGFLAAVISVVVGSIVGAATGYTRGYKEEIMTGSTELFQVIPVLFLGVTVVALWGSSFWVVVLVIGLTSWPTTARLVRAEFLSLRERPFVEAAKGLGAGDLRVTFGEILPNATPPIIVNASFEVGRAIIIEAALSFLGLGDANVPSLGRLLHEAQPYLVTAWWMSVFPGLSIVLIVLSLNLVGDGLNETMNPRMRER